MNVVNHVAIIMDGNGRWGIKKRGSRRFGHLSGFKNLEKIVDFSLKNNIPYLTLFAFSTENWRRPKSEIKYLFDLIRKYFNRKTDTLVNKGVKIKIIGKKNTLPFDIKKILHQVEKRTKKNFKINLFLALNYGSKEEIINAFKKVPKSKIKNLNIKNFETYLYTSGAPSPDILIRTGGHHRLSNFLLWQSAYTELFFINKLWPDFNEIDLKQILNKYRKIKRNFGKI